MRNRVIFVALFVLGIALGFVLMPMRSSSTKHGRNTLSQRSSGCGANDELGASGQRTEGRSSVGSNAPSSSADGQSGQNNRPGSLVVSIDRAVRDQTREQLKRSLGSRYGDTNAGPENQPLPASTAAPSGSVNPPALPPSYIQDVVRKDFFPMARSCYENALAQSPKLAGKAVISFTIVADHDVGGIVDSAEFADGSTIDDEGFKTCITESMMNMTFKAPEGGGSVHVTYPISFSQDPDPADSSPRNSAQ